MGSADVKSATNLPSGGVQGPARKKYKSPHLNAYGTLTELTGSPSPTTQGEDTGTGTKSGGSSSSKP